MAKSGKRHKTRSKRPKGKMAATGSDVAAANANRKPNWRIGRPKGTGTQRVYTQIRDDIIGLRLPPGTDVEEASLEQRFGVSRTPVREALIRLASEGLIVLLPNRGARVTQIDISDLPQIFEALELCQRATIRWAAVRRSSDDVANMREINNLFLEAAKNGDSNRMGEANKEFHSVIGRACGNRYFESLYSSLLAVSLRLARTAFAYAPQVGEPYEEYYLEVVRQHEAMISAIEVKDVETADKLARVHTDLFRDRINRYLRNNLASTIALDSIA
jgi:DNA-binding GntR family transcriptional regulator